MSRILCLRFRPPPADDEPAPNRNARYPLAPAFELSAALRAQLRADVDEFSPVVGWVAGWPADCLALEIGATSRWFGGEAALVERVEAWTGEFRLGCRAAVANTLGTAWAAAHYALPSFAQSGGTHSQSNTVPPFVARLIAGDETLRTLAPLPIESLRLTKPTAMLLRELGIDFVGKLCDLPRAALAERFDPELLLRLNQALGTEPELFAVAPAEPLPEAGLAWEDGVAAIEPLVEVCDKLLPKVLKPVAERGHGVARIAVELQGESRGIRRLVVGLMRPSVDRRRILDLIALRFESIRFVEPVVGLRLIVLEAAPPALEQQVLFAELAPPIEAQAWTTLIERLTGRLGPDAVSQVRFSADHQPERAWRAVPQLTAGAPRNVSSPAKKSTTKKLATKPMKPKPAAQEFSPRTLPRPTLLLAEPRSIRVISTAPQGNPQRFRDLDGEHRVARSWGPERIETGWWRGPSVRRDYYRVATDTGTHCWLYRDLRTREWFLHGWFD